MLTKITNFTSEEKEKKISINLNGDTVMYDKEGREWKLFGEFNTKKEVEIAAKKHRADKINKK